MFSPPRTFPYIERSTLDEKHRGWMSLKAWLQLMKLLLMDSMAFDAIDRMVQCSVCGLVHRFKESGGWSAAGSGIRIRIIISESLVVGQVVFCSQFFALNYFSCTTVRKEITTHFNSLLEFRLFGTQKTFRTLYWDECSARDRTYKSERGQAWYFRRHQQGLHRNSKSTCFHFHLYISCYLYLGFVAWKVSAQCVGISGRAVLWAVRGRRDLLHVSVGRDRGYQFSAW